ncbi:MAG: hypothetical protein AABX31_01375 [Nanoarchaeota archaeon]
MNLKDIMYASALSTILVTQGCTALPDLKSPEARARLEGTYRGVLDGNKVSYKVSKYRCAALVDFWTGITLIVDNDCDNTADFMNLQDRKYLLETGKAKDVDEVLESIQRNLVKPEYKVK